MNRPCGGDHRSIEAESMCECFDVAYYHLNPLSNGGSINLQDADAFHGTDHHGGRDPLRAGTHRAAYAGGGSRVDRHKIRSNKCDTGETRSGSIEDG